MSRRRGIASAGIVVVLAAGCGSSGVSVPAPSPTGAVATACRRLISELPKDLDPTLRHRSVSPSSPFTIAWGNPAATLRCGLPAPSAYTDDTQIPIGHTCWGTPDSDADPTIWHTRGSVPYVVVSAPATVVAANILAVVSPLVSASKCTAD